MKKNLSLIFFSFPFMTGKFGTAIAQRTSEAEPTIDKNIYY